MERKSERERRKIKSMREKRKTFKEYRNWLEFRTFTSHGNAGNSSIILEKRRENNTNQNLIRIESSKYVKKVSPIPFPQSSNKTSISNFKAKWIFVPHTCTFTDTYTLDGFIFLCNSIESRQSKKKTESKKKKTKSKARVFWYRVLLSNHPMLKHRSLSDDILQYCCYTAGINTHSKRTEIEPKRNETKIAYYRGLFLWQRFRIGKRFAKVSWTFVILGIQLYSGCSVTTSLQRSICAHCTWFGYIFFWSLQFNGFTNMQYFRNDSVYLGLLPRLRKIDCWLQQIAWRTIANLCSENMLIIIFNVIASHLMAIPKRLSTESHSFRWECSHFR